MWALGTITVAKGLKSCLKCNKSPNLVTLFPAHTKFVNKFLLRGFSTFYTYLLMKGILVLISLLFLC